MEKFKKGLMNIQLFGEDPQGAETSNENAQIDYESEYKKVLAERDAFKADAEKQKLMKDKYASENAEYKRKEVEKMSDEEKKSKEYQDLVESKNKIEAELNEIKLEREILGAGFTNDECKKLMSNKQSMILTFKEILDSRLVENEKTIKAKLLKDSTPDEQLGYKGTDGKKSAFQQYQESKQKTPTKIEI